MNLLRSFHQIPLLVLVLGLFVLALSGCPKQQPPDNAGDASEKPVVHIANVNPSSTIQGQPVTVKLRGHGFVEGSQVYLGTSEARGVDVYADDELTFRAGAQLEVGGYDVRIVTPAGDQAVATARFEVLSKPEERSDCSLVTVFFEFNESKLSDQTRTDLSNNATCIEEQNFGSVRLGGHADERGSTIFNISLGEERAEAVRDYLVNLGVEAKKLSIVSYGEEQPLDSGSSEASWARNRRVEFSVQ